MLKQKTRLTTIITATILSLLLSINTFAATEAAPQTDYDSLTDFKIHADVPDSFRYRVEIFLDYTPFVLTYMEDIDNNGYDMTTAVKDGVYKVNVMSSEDVGNYYDYIGPETFSPQKDKALNITIRENDNYYALLNDDAVGDFHFEDDGSSVIKKAEAEIFDFSEGKEYGTVHLDCVQYPAFESVTFKLTGNGHIYEIPLNNDNLYMADVLLPAGQYYESQLSNPELIDTAYVPKGMTFVFAHENNMSFWGNYYTVEAGQEVDINDIIILMEYQGETSEVDSNFLFSPTFVNNLANVRQRHVDEKLQEFFPELYEDEPETIPEIAEQETVEENGINLKVIIAVILVILLIIGIVMYIVIVYV